MIFHIFLRGTSGGLSSLILNSGIIKSLNLEKEIFPVVATVAIGILAFVDVAVFFGLMSVFEFIPDWTIIFIPIILLLLIVLVLGMSYLLSIITVYVRDVQIMWTIFGHSLLFISPIFWRLDQVDGVLLQIQKINPLGQLIELAHSLVIYKQIPPVADWLYTTAIIFGIFFFGFFVFHKMEDKVAEKL